MNLLGFDSQNHQPQSPKPLKTATPVPSKFSAALKLPSLTDKLRKGIDEEHKAQHRVNFLVKEEQRLLVKINKSRQLADSISATQAQKQQ